MRKAGSIRTGAVSVGQEFERWRLNKIIDFDGRSVAILERDFEKHGLLVFASVDKVIAQLKKPVGTVNSRQISHILRYAKDYYDKLLESKEDILAEKVLSEGGCLTNE